jgi:hypothetical protein
MLDDGQEQAPVPSSREQLLAAIEDDGVRAVCVYTSIASTALTMDANGRCAL